MPVQRSTDTHTKCKNCGFDAPIHTDAWDTATHPTLGTLTQCPECGSTDTTGI
jgi:predicted RNA-binding Zn-ribbon protein involved in translation (DUF1610 family)